MHQGSLAAPAGRWGLEVVMWCGVQLDALYNDGNMR
jgi:hypothetical protein